MIVVKLEKQRNQWSIKPGPIGKLLIHLCCSFSTYYLCLWARKCCVVICILITNTTLVVRLYLEPCEISWGLETFSCIVSKITSEDTEEGIYKCFSRKSFANFTGKTPMLESLFTKVAGPQAGNFIKKKIQHRCFTVKFTKFLRAPF